MKYRHQQSHVIQTNANMVKRASPAPEPHFCSCRFCHDIYLGFGAKCPDCVRADADAVMLKIAENAAIIETRLNQPKPARTETYRCISCGTNYPEYANDFHSLCPKCNREYQTD